MCLEVCSLVILVQGKGKHIYTKVYTWMFLSEIFLEPKTVPQTKPNKRKPWAESWRHCAEQREPCGLWLCGFNNSGTETVEAEGWLSRNWWTSRSRSESGHKWYLTGLGWRECSTIRFRWVLHGVIMLANFNCQLNTSQNHFGRRALLRKCLYQVRINQTKEKTELGSPHPLLSKPE